MSDKKEKRTFYAKISEMTCGNFPAVITNSRNDEVAFLVTVGPNTQRYIDEAIAFNTKWDQFKGDNGRNAWSTAYTDDLKFRCRKGTEIYVNNKKVDMKDCQFAVVVHKDHITFAVVIAPEAGYACSGFMKWTRRNNTDYESYSNNPK